MKASSKKAKNENSVEIFGSFVTSDVNLLSFPVVKKPSEIEAINSVAFDVIAYPFKTVKMVEIPKQNFTELKNVLAIGSTSENFNLPKINEFEAMETTEFIEVETWDLSRPVRLNSCSDRYELISCEAIFPVIENILTIAEIQFTKIYRVDNFSRFYATYIIEDKRFHKEIAKGDTIKVMINVNHSYNGLTKYSINISFLRLICLNGMTASDETLSICGKHTVNIKASFENFSEKLQQLKESDFIHAITEKYRLLNNVPILNLKESIEKTLKNCGIAIIENSKFNTLNDIALRIYNEISKPELQFNGILTNWHLYNGINAFLYDSTLSIASPEIRSANDKKVFDYLVKQSKSISTEIVKS